jgi:hypothetical protein
VVARPALAEVVQQRGQQQQVRAAHSADQGGGVHGGLDQVPVDRPSVEGVALRLAAHPPPLGQQRVHHTGLVQRLDDADRAGAGAEQRDQRLARPRRPRFGQARPPRLQPPQRLRRQRHAGAGRLRRDLQREPGPGGQVGAGGQQHLAVVGDHAAGELAAHRAAPAPHRRAGVARVHPPPALVERPGQCAAGLVHPAHQRLGSGLAEPGGDRVLLLEAEAVDRGAGTPDLAAALLQQLQVQRLAGVQQQPVGGLAAPVEPGGHPGRGDRAHRVPVP